MAVEAHKGELTGSLEDYLETIYLLIQERRVARVRDIARARNVKAGSVTPALRRLADLGLIEYEQREYIDLTERGRRAARRVLARHQLLTRFFDEVLQMPPEAANAEACKLEHSLSDEAMDRLVRFFEFLAVCPHRPPALLDAFHDCQLVEGTRQDCPTSCPLREPSKPPSALPERGSAGARKGKVSGRRRTASGNRVRSQPRRRKVTELGPGERGRVVHVNARGQRRQQLLDKGVLPDAAVEMLRTDPGDGRVWIRLHGIELSLGPAEAEAVVVVAE